MVDCVNIKCQEIEHQLKAYEECVYKFVRALDKALMDLKKIDVNRVRSDFVFFQDYPCEVEVSDDKGYHGNEPYLAKNVTAQWEFEVKDMLMLRFSYQRYYDPATGEADNHRHFKVYVNGDSVCHEHENFAVAMFDNEGVFVKILREYEEAERVKQFRSLYRRYKYGREL